MVMIVSSLDTGMYVAIGEPRTWRSESPVRGERRDPYVASGEPRKIMLRSRRDLMNSDTYILFVRRFSAGTVTWLK